MKSALIAACLGTMLAACGGNDADGPTRLLAGTAQQSAAVSIAGYRGDYTITVDHGQATVTNKADASDVRTFAGVKLLRFVDKDTSLDPDGLPGQVYRLYQAAFNRKPDPAGLGFWIDNADTNHLTLETVAGYFLDSPESVGLYGQNPTNDRLVTATYTNVLHRAPERAGFDWWVNAMNNGVSRQAMLYSFSESRENRDNLLPDMANGFDYAPFAGVPPATAAAIVAAIVSGNIDYLPGANGRAAGTWHWAGTPARHVPVLIPRPGNGTEQDYAAKAGRAIADINARLDGLLVLEAVDAAPASGSYIQVGYDTAYVPPGGATGTSFCANVSTAPYSGNPVAPDGAGGVTARPVHVNLGNGHCDVTQDIVIHEFGHALGLGNHFDGFGANGTPPISALFWDVLATLYGNPRATAAGDLVVKRAK